MAERLGEALFWAGMVVSGVVFALGIGAVVTAPPGSLAPLGPLKGEQGLALATFIIAAVPLAIGAALRYVLRD